MYDPIQTSSPPIAEERKEMVLGMSEKEVHSRGKQHETEEAHGAAEVLPISFY